MLVRACGPAGAHRQKTPPRVPGLNIETGAAGGADGFKKNLL